MSEAYCEKFEITSDPIRSDDMREFCKRPGKVNKDGTICYFTEQSHKDTCDINKIIANYDRQGIISHVTKIEAKFGDMTGSDFKTMSDQIIEAKRMFNGLPSKIREEFENNPAKLLEFMEDPNNRDRAIELGLIDEMTPASKDGLGEHVKIEPNPEPNPEPET